MKQTQLVPVVALLFGSFSLAGGTYYKVVGVADNDTLSVRAKPSARAKKIAALQPYDTGLVIWKRKRVAGSRWCSVSFLQEDVMGYIRGLNAEFNWVFSQWSGIFANDKVVTTAILDRLLHHSHVINILGDSYRLKEKKEEEMNGSDLYEFEPKKSKK